MSDATDRSDTQIRPRRPSPVPPAGNPKVQQLFARITQEIEEKDPADVIYFIVDFLCKHYPQHLGGFASVWNDDADLERDRLQVIEFFRFQKIPVKIAEQFIAVGFDTLETLCTVTQEHLPAIERDSQAVWLQGHRVRLLQTFSDVCNRVRAFRQEREKILHIARLTSGHCEHPTIVTRTNAPHMPLLPTTVGPNPLPNIRVLAAPAPVHHVMPPPMSQVTLGTTSSPFVCTSMP